MKRFASVLLMFALLLSLAACSGKEPAPAPQPPAPVEPQTPAAPEPEAPQPEPEPELPAVVPLEIMKGPQFLYEADEDYNDLCTVTWSHLAVADGFPSLADALEELNTEQAVGAFSFMQEWLPYAEEVMAENPEYFGGFTLSSDYTVQRADSLMLSLREDFDSYTGGVHGNYGVMGWNFDTATGARLELADVLIGTDGLDKILSEKLREKYPFEPFESLDLMLADYTPQQYNWTLGYQGITFYFNPYEIAAYASGLLTATIWFDEMPELFREEYTVVPTAGYAMALPYWHTIEADFTPGDGQRDALAFWTTEDEYGAKHLSISLNGQEYDEETWCSFSMKPYLVCTNGKFYLYVEGSGENDFRSLNIYDLNNGAPQLISDFPGAGFVGIWDPDAGQAGVYYTTVFNNPLAFTLGSNCNLLGTKTAYRNYTVLSDGTLAPLSDFYELDRDLLPITSVRPLNVMILPEKTVETVPAGTEFSFLRTDNETYVDLAMADGRECRIVIEEIDWTPCINGVPEWDCFADLMYAG